MGLNERVSAGAVIMGQALSGLAAAQDEFGADLRVDEETGRVWAEVEMEDGNVYELSAAWVRGPNDVEPPGG